MSSPTPDIQLKVRRADGFLARFKGLMFENSIGSVDALWIKPCAGIHTFFMRFPIDVIFLNADFKILKLCPNIPPNRIGPFCLRASSVLECKSGLIARAGLKRGHSVSLLV